jgi:hypothetical protein
MTTKTTIATITKTTKTNNKKQTTNNKSHGSHPPAMVSRALKTAFHIAHLLA